MYVLETTPERVTAADAEVSVNVPIRLVFALTAVMVPSAASVTPPVVMLPLTVEAIRLLPLNLVRAAVALISVLSSLISSTI